MYACVYSAIEAVKQGVTALSQTVMGKIVVTNISTKNKLCTYVCIISSICIWYTSPNNIIALCKHPWQQICQKYGNTLCTRA